MPSTREAHAHRRMYDTINPPPEKIPVIEEWHRMHRGLLRMAIFRAMKKFPGADEQEVESAGWNCITRCAIAFRPELGFKPSTLLMASLNRWCMKAAFNSLKREHIGPRAIPRQRLPDNLDRNNAPQFRTPSVLSGLIESEDREVALKWLRAALNSLAPRDRRVLELRIMEGRTLREVGEDIGVTRERVRQIETRLLGELARRWCNHRRRHDCDIHAA